jgi:hypothetical protein
MCQDYIANIVDNMDGYHLQNKMQSSLNQIGYDVNTVSVTVKEHPYDITKCIWKEGLEIYKTQVQLITPVLDDLNIKYNIMIVRKKTFPIIVLENGNDDYRLLLKNIHLIPVIGGLYD